MVVIQFLLLSFLSALPVSEPKLTIDYYKEKCPSFEQIVLQTLASKQLTNPATAAGTLRLFFHNCMVEGCDGSILVSSNSFNCAEHDAEINLSLSGDAFDLITRIKTTLELSCPGVVSCADILAVATRDLVRMVGGPYYTIRLGRKDGLVSKYTIAEANLPRGNMTMDEIISYFAR